jgi:hypothetical protein
MNKYSWTPMRCAQVCTIILTISSFLFLFLIFSCPELKFQYTSCTSLNTPCCQSIYDPGTNLQIYFSLFKNFSLVCDVNDAHQMYLSPCHFGCTNQTTSNNNNSTYFYSSCSCGQNIVLSESSCRFRRIPCKIFYFFKNKLFNYIFSF